MAILFTEGFGLYGAIGTDAKARFIDKWDTVTNPNSAAINIVDGRHVGTTDTAVEGITAATLPQLFKTITVSGTVVIIGLAHKVGTLTGVFLELLTAADVSIMSLAENASGALDVTGNGAIGSAAGAITSGSWAYFEVRVECTAGGNITVRKNNTQIFSAANGHAGALTPAKVRLQLKTGRVLQDIVVLDTSGLAPQNTYIGDVRIETLFPNAEGSQAQFTTVESNLLTVNQGDLETDTTGWAAGTNTTISRVTTFFNTGVASLQLSTNASGNSAANTPTGVSGIPVIPGASYTGSAFWRIGNAASRLCRVDLLWYTAAGALISTSTGTAISSSTTWTQASVTAISPGNAAFVAVTVAVDVQGASQGGGETQHVDTIKLSSTSHVNAIREPYQDGDRSYVESSVAGHKETFGHTDLATVSGTILAVRPYLTLARQTAGATTLGALAIPSPPVVPIIRSFTTFQNNSASSVALVLAKPAGTVANDLLLYFITESAETAVPTGSGLTKLYSSAESNANSNVFYKVADGNEAASFDFGSGSFQSGVCFRISGASTTTPIHVSSRNYTASGNVANFTSITTTALGCLLMASAHGPASISYTPPAGFLEHVDINGVSTFCTEVSSRPFRVAAATGALTAQGAGASGVNDGILIAIAPVPPTTITDYDSTATVSPDASNGVYKTLPVEFRVNPATGNPWTVAEVNAAEFGFKIVT